MAKKKSEHYVNNKELLELAGTLADKHNELKSIILKMLDEIDRLEKNNIFTEKRNTLELVITDMCDEMDAIELEYEKIIKKIKNN